MVTETLEPQVDNADLIEELLREADPKLEPGTVRPLDILHRGDNETPVPAIVDALRSAGYTYIYDTRTGDRSLTNRNMLAAQLKKKREDGSLVFSIRKPAVIPFMGKFRCLLHPERPERRDFDAQGYLVCRKANIPNQHQLNLHMRRKHKVEWEAIEEARKEKERQEDRLLQRLLLQSTGKNLIGQEPTKRKRGPNKPKAT